MKIKIPSILLKRLLNVASKMFIRKKRFNTGRYICNLVFIFLLLKLEGQNTLSKINLILWIGIILKVSESETVSEFIIDVKSTPTMPRKKSHNSAPVRRATKGNFEM